MVVCSCIDSTTRSPAAAGWAVIELSPGPSLVKTFVCVMGAPTEAASRCATGAGVAIVALTADRAGATGSAAAPAPKAGEARATTIRPMVNASNLEIRLVTRSLLVLDRPHGSRIQTCDQLSHIEPGVPARRRTWTADVHAGRWARASIQQGCVAGPYPAVASDPGGSTRSRGSANHVRIPGRTRRTTLDRVVSSCACHVDRLQSPCG